MSTSHHHLGFRPAEAKRDNAPRKMKPFTERWLNIARELAFQRVRMVACKPCGFPRFRGERCLNCRDNSNDVLEE